MDLDLILSEKFIEFSNRIAEIQERKKKRKEEFKVLYEAYQNDIKSLESEAKSLLDDFEAKKSD